MGGDVNAVTLITPEREERWPELDKHEVARRLAERVAAALKEPPTAPARAAE